MPKSCLVRIGARDIAIGFRGFPAVPSVASEFCETRLLTRSARIHAHYSCSACACNHIKHIAGTREIQPICNNHALPPATDVRTGGGTQGHTMPLHGMA